MVTTNAEHENSPASGLFPLKFMPPSLGNPVIASTGTDQILPRQAGEGLTRGEVSRLVILLPDEDVDEARLSRYIWSLASPGKLSILLVTLVNEPGEEYTALRRMTRIGGITQDIWIKVNAKVVFGGSWSQTIGSFAPTGGFAHLPG